MSSQGCFRILSRRLISHDSSSIVANPFLPVDVQRKVKSRDDAYTIDNILVYNDTNMPSDQTTPFHIFRLQAHTEVQYGGSRLLLGVSTSVYEECRRVLSISPSLPSLYFATNSVCKELWDISVESIPCGEICRKQIRKDLGREEVLVNNHNFHSNDSKELRTYLTNKIEAFSRGNLATFAILRHLLTFLCRTESGGDIFTIVRDLFPTSVLVTTVLTSKNPVRIRISETAHVTIDIVSIFRITPDQPSQSMFSFLTKPFFAPPNTSSMDTEVDTRDSFVLLGLIRCKLFYCTGDMNGVDLHKQTFFKCVTNRNLENIDPFDYFNSSTIIPVEPWKNLVYYDVNIVEKKLYMTIECDHDEDMNVILKVKSIERHKQIHPNIAPDHILVSIGGVSLHGGDYDELVHRVTSTPRPCILRMCYYI